MKAATDRDQARRRPGRPVDTTIDTRAIAATRELLVERGYDQTTVHAVARRAGVHASALYRRWPSRLELIEDAVFTTEPAVQAPPSGDLARDLHDFISSWVTQFDSPEARAAGPHLLAAAGTRRRDRDGEAWRRVSRRPRFRELVAAAPDGTVDSDVDLDEVFEVLLGTVLTRMMVPVEVRPPPPVERTVALMLRILRPPGRSQGT